MALVDDPTADPALSYGDPAAGPVPWDWADRWTDPAAAEAVPDPFAAPLPAPATTAAPEPVTEPVEIGPGAPTAPYDETGAPVVGPGLDPGIAPPLFETGVIDNPYAPPPLADAPPSVPVPFGAAPPQLPQLPPAEIAPAPAFGPQLPPPLPPPPVAPTLDITAKDPFAGMSDADAFQSARTLAQTDQIAFDQLIRNREATKQAKAEADRLRAEETNLQQLKDNLEARRIADEKTQKQQDQITKDALELSKRPLDRRRYFKNQSVVGNIFAAIATVAGGLSSRAGGPNMGLDYLNKLIDDDINDQKADLENEKTGIQARQGAVGQEYARTGNLFQAAETVRQATYQSVIAKMQAEQQNYDPRGQGYIDHGIAIQGMRAKAAAAQEAARKVSFEENNTKAKAALEAARFEEEKRKNRADQAIARQRESREAATAKKTEQAWTPEQLRVLNPDSPVPPVPMTLPQFKQWQDIQKGGQDLKAAQRANDPETLARESEVPNVVTESGKRVQFKPDEAKEIKKAMYLATELVRKSDELRALVNEHGFDAGWTKSPYFQQAQQIYNDMILMDKSINALGALSQSDIKLEQANLGTDDPTQLRDTTAGMEAYRRARVEGINSMLAIHAVLPDGERVKRWNPVDTSKLPKAAPTPEQTRMEIILAKPDESYDELVRQEMYKAQAGLSPEQLRDPYYRDKTLQEGIAAASEIYDSSASSKQQAAIRELQVEATGKVGDPKADRARAELTKIISDADSATVRALAARALEASVTADILSTGAPPVDYTVPYSDVARETVPPPPPRKPGRK